MQNRDSHGVAWLAGEASGDYLASLVLPALKERMHGALQFGVGGPKMIEAGLDAWFPSDCLSVRGYVEVLKKIPSILRLRGNILKRLKKIHPDVFIGVDAPDFNLGVESRLKASGIKTVHMVSPSIWAWRPERIKTVAAATDHVLLIFPFEEAIYAKAGVPATYIGHPLAGIIPLKPDKKAALRRLSLENVTEPVFAVLPGSRIDEVKGCASVFFKACENVLKRIGRAHFIVPAVDENKKTQIDRILELVPSVKDNTTVVLGQSHTVLEASDVVLAASGTATLEAALFKKTVVVGYTMPSLSAWLMRYKGLIPYVSLPNILCQERVIPEFLHFFCKPDLLAASLVDQLEDKRQEELRRRFTVLHNELRRDTAKLASDAITRLIQ